jgi:RNA polymerase sigma-70 factor (ECF subfamily)
MEAVFQPAEAEMARQSFEAQFTRIMEAHSPSVMRLASAYETNPANRDDLVQDIALALWAALPRFRSECSERTLVFRIAHNRAVTHLWRRRRAPDQPDESAEPVDRRPTPESQASESQLHGRLMGAIRQLAPGRREVMVMLLEGMTHAEIAHVLGTSEGNVAVRATRARKELRDLLGELR